MKANLMALGETRAAYLKQVTAGLKGMSESQQQEILAEIRSHLAERAQQFAGQGFRQPEEAAIAAMGDAGELAMQFARTASVQEASRSFAPWTLLRAAAGIAFTGIKGLLTFLLGVVGYGTALAFSVSAVLKLIMPAKVGFWVGPHLFVWGVTPTTPNRHELAGRYFVLVSVALAFLFASGTTLALRWLTRSGLSLESVLKRRTL
jgi:uncharacterized membrane protein